MLFAITLHEVAHGWMARYFGDRTAEMLGRLSLNPLRHIDPDRHRAGSRTAAGLRRSAVRLGEAGAGGDERAAQSASRAMLMVALAGPAANVLMALAWCAVLAAIARVNGNADLGLLDCAHGPGRYCGQRGSCGVSICCPFRRSTAARVLVGIAAVALQCSPGKIRTHRHVRRGNLGGAAASQPVFVVLFSPVFHGIGHFIKVLMDTSA